MSDMVCDNDAVGGPAPTEFVAPAADGGGASGSTSVDAMCDVMQAATLSKRMLQKQQSEQGAVQNTKSYATAHVMKWMCVLRVEPTVGEDELKTEIMNSLSVGAESKRVCILFSYKLVRGTSDIVYLYFVTGEQREATIKGCLCCVGHGVAVVPWRFEDDCEDEGQGTLFRRISRKAPIKETATGWLIEASDAPLHELVLTKRRGVSAGGGAVVPPSGGAVRPSGGAVAVPRLSDHDGELKWMCVLRIGKSGVGKDELCQEIMSALSALTVQMGSKRVPYVCSYKLFPGAPKANVTYMYFSTTGVKKEETVVGGVFRIGLYGASVTAIPWNFEKNYETPGHGKLIYPVSNESPIYKTATGRYIQDPIAQARELALAQQRPFIGMVVPVVSVPYGGREMEWVCVFQVGPAFDEDDFKTITVEAFSTQYWYVNADGSRTRSKNFYVVHSYRLVRGTSGIVYLYLVTGKQREENMLYCLDLLAHYAKDAVIVSWDLENNRMIQPGVAFVRLINRESGDDKTATMRFIGQSDAPFYVLRTTEWKVESSPEGEGDDSSSCGRSRSGSEDGSVGSGSEDGGDGGVGGGSEDGGDGGVGGGSESSESDDNGSEDSGNECGDRDDCGVGRVSNKLRVAVQLAGSEDVKPFPSKWEDAAGCSLFSGKHHDYKAAHERMKQQYGLNTAAKDNGKAAADSKWRLNKDGNWRLPGDKSGRGFWDR